MQKTINQFALLVVSIITFGVFNANAQDTKTDNHTVAITIPEVALLDIEATTKNITAAFIAPTEAGSPITAPVNNTDLWLNYSSIVTPSGGTDPSRKVSVKASAVIPGVSVNVTAATATVTGAGTKGTPVGSAVTLTTADQDLITGIGSCWTDTGVSKGHQLTYAIGLTSAGTYGNLVSGTITLSVTYTLSDN